MWFMKASNANLKLSFYLKKNVARNGLCPVMGRLTVGNDMVQFSCKTDADPKLWDVPSGRAKGKSHEARKINREIDKINVAVHAGYREIVSLRGKATATEVKNAFQGISSAQETLLKIFREHNEEYKKRTGVNIAAGTWRNYENSIVHLQRFIRRKYHVRDLSFRQLDYSFIENFEYYLRIDCKLKPNTMLNKLSCLRKMVKIAIGRGIISRDPFFGFSPERPKACQKYVPADELEKLMNTPMNKRSQEIIRDMFVFSCFTGLSYIDLFNLTGSQIVKTDDGSMWLNINRQKTGIFAKIPLLDEPLKIIEKYRGTAAGDRVFPMRSNSAVNQQLKRIAEQCGIERRLHFHAARHTFATETCLSQGVPIETVSRMMGHKKLSTTQIYAKVTHSKVDEDMEALSEKINGKFILAL
jgi:site-specific recombinase XerD